VFHLGVFIEIRFICLFITSGVIISFIIRVVRILRQKMKILRTIFVNSAQILH